MRAAAMALLLAGCTVTAVPPDAVFAVPPDAAAKRVRQSRRYDTRDEALVLRASAALLMDLGFISNKSEESLGVLVASKERTAVETGQVIAALVIGALAGTYVPYDDHQRLRASVVTHPSGQKSVVVRVTFQRIVWDTSGQVTKREQLDRPEYYQEFFERLSKALLLEAHDA
ncbi:MAG: hypothetical protein L6Q95_02015 [Planctomycetes bacterium]|nr:hypothetical protein [Planctomycetota bacterium]